MAESIVSDVVFNILKVLGQSTLEEIAPYFGGRNKLKELQQTMMMIQARVHDAERRRDGEDGALVKLWLKRLKHVLYQMEDLFEDVAIADKVNEKMPGGKLSKTLCVFLSRTSPFRINKKVAQEAKAFLKEFKTLTSQMNSLNLALHSVDEQLAFSLSNKERSCSFILEEEVIGRDEDRKIIVEMVLNTDDIEGRVSVIPIVGIGGLGKTALAQLVFNDKNVQKHFELKGWSCISEVLNTEDFIRKILNSIIGSDCRQLSMDQLQICLQNAVSDKKYLLVLDDIWDEDRERWLSLKRLLSSCKRGSKIIVTSRSKVVALNMGTVRPYELKGLSEDKSWQLFRSLAFKEGQERRNPSLTRIGREIVEKCANVPLAIRTIAGLLYSKDAELEWKLLKDKELRMIEQNQVSIMSTLKLSYDHLPSQLKQCFAYCSIFPKGYVLRKQHLIDLWMAQGFFMLSHGSQSPEDIGDVCFLELLRRSFFQDDVRGADGDIISCKMHDLMHDLAQHVAGGEIAVVDGSKLDRNDGILHASLYVDSSREVPSSVLAAKKMRSFLLLSHTKSLSINEVFSSLTCLRTLDLLKADCEALPRSIEKLVHLRYLRFGCSLMFLCEPITTLPNLQTLDLRVCKLLTEYPSDFYKLINLRHLYNGKIGLQEMPPRFGLLASLCNLDKFVVGKNNGLNALGYLNNLVGRLVIYIAKHRREAISEAMMANLKEKKLVDLVVHWSFDLGTRADEDEEALVLEYMQPPPTLRRLHVLNWMGIRFPRWGIDASPCSLPNLVSLCIEVCHRCRHLPPLSKLPNLRFLELGYLEVLEYVDNGGNDTSDVFFASTSASAAVYFPSLKRLELHHLRELKGWSRTELKNVIHQERHNWNQQYFSLQRVFPCLSLLRIYSCPKLMSMPLVPRLESLEAYDINGTLLKRLLRIEDSSAISSQDSKRYSSNPSVLRKLDIESVHGLNSLTINIHSLESLTLKGCHELTNLVAEYPISLQQLIISECGRLKGISGTMKHLSSLVDLKLSCCEEVDLWDIKDNEEEEGASKLVAWKSLKSLRSLTLYAVSKLKTLPKGLCCVTTLQELYLDELSELQGIPEWISHLTKLRCLSIRNCHKVEALPESFYKLTMLQELNIWKCPELERRCEQTEGQDCPLIPSTVSICRY